LPDLFERETTENLTLVNTRHQTRSCLQGILGKITGAGSLVGNTAYHDVVNDIEICEKNNGRTSGDTTLVVVSKTFANEQILPIVNAGARIFGENRVQEAAGKWPEIRKQYDTIELHLIGPLQSNKAAEAVKLFDVIQTIDREKIAAAISKEMNKQNKYLQLFVQVNTGSEQQKAGILSENTIEFVTLCREKYGLQISGLMCIPPNNENPGPHFALLNKLSKKCKCKYLSMGMSADFKSAIEFGATHVRVGSAIFGNRGNKNT
jgi:pyridoxal phosphate enzyme (YggS family)